jgi:ring-1,2-phenylacetyl-CoA epoxidase subunit PaaE
MAVMVKRVDDGLMSNWLPDNLKKGVKLRVLEPIGKFTTDFDKEINAIS